MSDYKYKNKYEQDETQQFEGAYTAEEIELNKKLFDECTKETIDFGAVEALLKQGTDPLGPTEADGLSLLEHVYGEVVTESQNNDSVDLPKVTELFLKYGMDIDHPRIPYDDSDSINPMWGFAFVTNENAIHALKLLLDKNISADSFGKFWGHSIGDLVQIPCGDPAKDEFWNYVCTWALKMLMLGASYDHIFNGDDTIREFICYDYNDYDLHNFRDWNRYDYRFDTSHCEKSPELYRSFVYIHDKENGKKVWTIAVGPDGRKILAEMSEKPDHNDKTMR